MKKLLLLGSSLLFTLVSFGQLKKDPNTSLSLEQYWENQQKNTLSTKPFLNLFRKKEPEAERNIADMLSSLKETEQKNSMPVLYPDSDYVFNMPGTHAFDPTKVKGGVFFVTEPAIIRNCYNPPAYVEIKSRQDYFKIQHTNSTLTPPIQIRK